MGARGRKSAADMAIPPAPAPNSPVARKPGTPAHLRDAGATFYEKMLTETDIGSADQLAVLTRAAECLDRIAAAQVSIERHGEIVVNQYGTPKLNPAVTLEKTARDGFFAAMRMLDIEEPAKGYGWK